MLDHSGQTLFLVEAVADREIDVAVDGWDRPLRQFSPSGSIGA
jgi:hypothetical protein